MTANSTDLSTADAGFQAALQQLQKGEWAPALAALTSLAEQYPFDLELRALVDETTVRSHIDQDERDDRKTVWRRRLRHGGP